MIILLEEKEAKNVTVNRIDDVTYDVDINIDGETVNAEYKIDFKAERSIRQMANRIEKRAHASLTQISSVQLAVDTTNPNKLMLLDIYIYNH